MPETDEIDYTSHLLMGGSGHLVAYDETKPRRITKKPIGFTAKFPDKKKPPAKKTAKRSRKR